MPASNDDATKEPSTASTTWTTNHHLVGQRLSPWSGLFVTPTGTWQAVVDTDPINASTALMVQTFEPEDRNTRKPALWRSLLQAKDTPAAEVALLAMDNIAADGQESAAVATAAASPTPSGVADTTRATLPAPHCQAVVSEHLQSILHQRAEAFILPDLILTAAWEHVLQQYCKQQATNENAANSAGSSSSSPTSVVFAVPGYYRQSPNQYLVPPASNLQQQQQHADADTHSTAAAASVFYVTPYQLTQRIKAGCHTAWEAALRQHPEYHAVEAPAISVGHQQQQHHGTSSLYESRRSSSRIQHIQEVQQQQQEHHQQLEPVDMTDTVKWWKVVQGGKVAARLTDTLVNNENDDESYDTTPDKDNGNDDSEIVAAVKPEATVTNGVGAGITTDGAATQVLQAETKVASPDESDIVGEAKEEKGTANESADDVDVALEDDAGLEDDDDDDPVVEPDDQDFEPVHEEDEEDEEGEYVKENVSDLVLSGSSRDEEEDQEEKGEGELEEEEDEDIDVVHDENPYLVLSGLDLLEWLGRKTSKSLAVANLQELFPSLLLKPKKKKRRTIGDSGMSVKDVLSETDRNIWGQMLSSSSPLSSTARIILRPIHEDVSSVEKWETSFFSKSLFAVEIVDDSIDEEQEIRAAEEFYKAEHAYKKQKTWDSMRYKGIHGGYTIWPSWMDTVKTWREESESKPTVNGDKDKDAVLAPQEQVDASGAVEEDLALAQALAGQESDTRTSSRRTTRRAAEGGVFYGNQSSMTQRQLQDAVLRFVSLQYFQTVTGLLTAVPDDSSDPIRRIRTVLGKLVWKRNQLAQLPVQIEWSDTPIWKSLSQAPLISLQSATADDIAVDNDDSQDMLLVGYIQALHQTELQLRSLVLRHLIEVPVSIIATAADERAGTMEAMDNADFEDLSSIEWLSTGHTFLSQVVYRPFQIENTDDLTPCQWYRLQDYCQSVASTPEEGESAAITERNELGKANDTTAVERRIRFRAVPVASPSGASAGTSGQGQYLLLTEGQARAGLKAAEMERKRKKPTKSMPENPFAGCTAAKITLFPTDSSGAAQINGTVVGHDTILGLTGYTLHKILILPDEGTEIQEAVWGTLSFSSDGSIKCELPGESLPYMAQHFDYHSTSPAFKECRAIAQYIQRHPKGMPFMEPVDPIALGIPEYFKVVKKPMDITTLLHKLESGQYSNIPPSQAVGGSPVARMLNGPFRKDLERIFDNAMQFNPPDDWIYQAANTIKKAAVKRIEQASSQAEAKTTGRPRQRKSIYADEDSDVDMYNYESDADDDYDGQRKSRKRKRPVRMKNKEDASARTVERPIRLQGALSESMGLRGYFSNLPVNSDASTFGLPPEWSCRRKVRKLTANLTEKPNARLNSGHLELDELIAMHRQIEESDSSSLRRSTRQHHEEAPLKTATNNDNVEYFTPSVKHWSEGGEWPISRLQVEFVREKLHETLFAKLYYDKSSLLTSKSDVGNIGRFSDGSFPPYLGRVVPLHSPCDQSAETVWEIRPPYVLAALRWVIRGLIQSEHLSEVEGMTTDNLNSGVVLANHVYFWDSSLDPFDVLDQKELQRRKRANQDGGGNDESEEEIELSEYEKLRLARVARNAERLKALGLA